MSISIGGRLKTIVDNLKYEIIIENKTSDPIYTVRCRTWDLTIEILL